MIVTVVLGNIEFSYDYRVAQMMPNKHLREESFFFVCCCLEMTKVYTQFSIVSLTIGSVFLATAV